ncbi:MAG: tRNA pseudouridine(13) synthase TruD [Myxococcota bacterium]
MDRLRIERPFELPRPHSAEFGGTYKNAPEDFEVEELSLYDPDGRPGQLFLWVRKIGIGTPELVRILSSQLSVTSDSIGTAGLKDALAVTRQWVSIPSAAEANLPRLEDERVEILRVERNSTKLRTGELAGNRFRIVVRDSVSADAVRDFLSRAHGRFPAYFGAQRFGDKRDTHRLGLDLLRGKKRDLSPRLRRFALSAAQSALFNAYLASRVDDSTWSTAIEGDVLLRPSGADWFGATAEITEAVESGRAWVAGPIFGPHMRPSSGAAAALERDVLACADLTDTDFLPYKKLTAGTRRPLVMAIRDESVESVADGYALSFTLPSGMYATEVLAALGAAPA